MNSRYRNGFSLWTGRVLKRIVGSWFLSVAGNAVKWVEQNIYQRAGQQLTQVSQKSLQKSEAGVEIVTPEIRISGDMRVGGVLYVSEIRVGTLKADNISCKGVIDGISEYANGASRAASAPSPVTPVPGQGAGDISVNFEYTDNGGDYPLGGS